MEFTQLHRKDLTQVVWNRTNPQTSQRTRGNVQSGSWEISSVTQADSGFYNFRAKDNSLLRRKKLTVHGHILHFNKDVNEQLFIKYPVSFSLGKVTFIPKGTSESEILREGGSQDPNDNWMNGRFEVRIEAFADHLLIEPVESTDTGTFEFRDQSGYLVMSVYLEVNQVLPPYVVIGVVAGIIFVVIICCCCIKKCCCKKSSSKRSQSAPQSATASATNYYLQGNSEPAALPYSAVPSSNLSYQPVNPRVSVEPATTSHEPQYEHEPVIPRPSHVSQPPSEMHNPAQPSCAPTVPLMHNPPTMSSTPAYSEVVASTEQPDAPTLPLHSDPGPQFVVKGLTFPSAPLLGSDSVCEVYTSEKLNFL
ncbi:hypothetical protein INR49_024385 [Caranx melampygus]|nr:hypothetical protein INR49_024385 [Caranx melampygus]